MSELAAETGVSSADVADPVTVTSPPAAAAGVEESWSDTESGQSEACSKNVSFSSDFFFFLIRQLLVSVTGFRSSIV